MNRYLSFFYCRNALIYYNIPTIYLTYGICNTTFFSNGREILPYWKTYPIVYIGIASVPITIPIGIVIYSLHRYWKRQ